MEEFDHFQIFRKVLFGIQTRDFLEVADEMRLVIKSTLVRDARKRTEIFVLNQLQRFVESDDSRKKLLTKPDGRQEFAFKMPFADVEFFWKFINRLAAIRRDDFTDTTADRIVVFTRL